MVEFVLENQFSLAGPGADVGAVAWSPDSREIVIMATVLRQAVVFETAGGRLINTLRDLDGGGRSVAFDAAGQVIASPRQDLKAALTIWDYRNGRSFTVTGPHPEGDNPVGNALLRFSIDAARRRLAGLHRVRSGQGFSFEMAVYDAQTWQLEANLPVVASQVALAPDGFSAAVIGQSGQAEIVDVRSGAMALRIEANNNPLQHVAWHPNGECLATASIAEGYGRNRRTGIPGPLRDEHILQTWDTLTGQRMAVARGPFTGLESLDFSQDGEWLVTTTDDGLCRLWNSRSLEAVQVVASGLHPTTALALFSPDSKRILVVRTGAAAAAIYRLQR